MFSASGDPAGRQSDGGWAVDGAGGLQLLAYIYLAVSVAVHRSSHASPEIGLVPLTVPELVRLLRDTVIPPPCRDKTHRQHWSQWRRRHQYHARQAHQRWNAYADTTP